MNPRVLGLDVSTRCIGVALPDGRLRSIRPTIQVHDDDYPIVPARRCLQLANRVGTTIRQLPEKPDLAIIEAYLPASGGRAGRTMRRLVELGGCVRMALAALEVPFVEVFPAHLKQWATGSGGADKDAMVAAARSAGAHPANDDEADAYWLRDLGISYFDSWDHLSELQRLILTDRVRFPTLAVGR